MVIINTKREGNNMSFQCQALEADSELVKGDPEMIANRVLLLTFHLLRGSRLEKIR